MNNIPKRGAQKIKPDVLAVLSNQLDIDVTPRGVNHVKITGDRLDPKLYKAVNDVLGTLGGKWTRAVQAHVFPTDPTEALEAIIASGEYIDPKKAFAFFQTPDGVADKLVAKFGLLQTSDRQTILEPSAGDGALIRALERGLFQGNLTTVEVDKQRVENLKRDFPRAKHVHADFLTLQPSDIDTDRFDIIIGNPPFLRGRDVTHILHAYDNWLAPGGRLVMIGAASIRFRDTHDHKRLRGLTSVNGQVEDLPEGSFAESGTEVNTVIVMLDKP